MKKSKIINLTISERFFIKIEIEQGKSTFKGYLKGYNLNKSAIHLESFLSVFLPLVALVYFGWARVRLIFFSKIFQIGIQYLPIDSIQAYLQLCESNQSLNLITSLFIVEKVDLFIGSNTIRISSSYGSNDDILVNIHTTANRVNNFHKFYLLKRW